MKKINKAELTAIIQQAENDGTIGELFVVEGLEKGGRIYLVRNKGGEDETIGRITKNVHGWYNLYSVEIESFSARYSFLSREDREVQVESDLVGEVFTVEIPWEKEPFEITVHKFINKERSKMLEFSYDGKGYVYAYDSSLSMSKAAVITKAGEIIYSTYPVKHTPLSVSLHEAARFISVELSKEES